MALSWRMALLTVVFECISRLNHSCHSNAAFSWDADASMGVVKVKRPIAAGDEVSLNYGATSGDTQARRQYLEKRFNFVCACPLCTDEDEDDSTALLGMSWPPITDLEARWRCIRVLRGGAGRTASVGLRHHRHVTCNVLSVRVSCELLVVRRPAVCIVVLLSLHNVTKQNDNHPASNLHSCSERLHARAHENTMMTRPTSNPK